MADSINSYCDFVEKLPTDNVHRIYHDKEYGFPIHDDNALFARLILEINQAGLSWETILRKKENFFCAFDGFVIEKVANYTPHKVRKLLADPGIIRNRLKIAATIYNAKAILQLQQECGSFKNWLDQHHPLEKKEWVKLFKTRFKFTGDEITNEFLMSTGYLTGAHTKSCVIYQQIIKQKPAWYLKKTAVNYKNERTGTLKTKVAIVK